MTRICPPSLLPIAERAAEGAFELARPRKRRLAAKIMAASLGIEEPEAQLLARRFLRHSVQLAHFERRLGRSGALAEMPFRIVGRDHLETALARRKGVILNAMHRFASAQVVRELRAAGYPILVVIHNARSGSRLGRRWINTARQDMIDRCFPDRVELRDPDLTPRIVERLRAGGMVAIAADARTSSSAVRVRVLNSDTAISAGILDLARLTGSPIVPCDFLYEGRGLLASFAPPLALEPAATAEEFRQINIPRLVDALEQRVLAAPDQWGHWLKL
jgi:lauroyl/myristoyl acyltransferase